MLSAVRPVRVAEEVVGRGIRSSVVFIALALGACASTRSDGPFAFAVTPHVYEHATVAADHPAASEAGVEMLRRGGNAVDAAVAASFCLSVVRPESCGIGGGGFMLIAIPGAGSVEDRVVAINYREQCPRAVGPEHYVKLDDADASAYGWHAAGVPGTVAGLCHVLATYGTLDLASVLAPAIRLAESGFIADDTYVADRFEAEQEGARRGLPSLWSDHRSGSTLGAGDIVKNPDQARALRLIAEKGPSAFYQGPIAEAIVGTMEEHGGTITAGDLESFTVAEAPPLRTTFRGFDVYTMPPPSSGGLALAQTLGMIESRWRDVGSVAHHSAAHVHIVSEFMKHAFADRAAWLADPAYVEVPVVELLAPGYIDRMAWSISLTTTMTSSRYGSRPSGGQLTSPMEDSGTSHLSVIDENGMAVACTETINLGYGSLVTVPGFGFCLNNQMDDFTTRPGEANQFGLMQSERNQPEPGKRPLSSMSPTIVMRDGEVSLVVGASGGPRIISGTLQCMLDILWFGFDPSESVALPRFHHQWMPDAVRLEPGWPDGERLAETLRRRGQFVTRDTSSCSVQVIHRAAGGRLHAASDPRKGGRPSGY
jgi:gamma-glutamyltranspeptidase/glutathione hydrolase